ncbi:unnamed protein product [Adineta steineri]|uniref:G-protein coupled receptors family 1 profile domain-containing protein n=1 Tax=Adineta steineri TaxID=433720 RepID=A0A813W6V9_9BILA|nr:unnamed protein product [Adineta steineri]CAF1148588.1 unnamed protein product [Adineta steineri]CAF1275336.1 unnamed protein product [Adineta steineri]CAF1473918.1 unnamed protein product [Adineta steineri]
MFIGLLPFILNNGFNVELSQSPLFYCKFRYYAYQVCALISMTCICLATIDQYFATCSHQRWQQWCNIKLARHLVTIFVFIWFVHNIPYLIYYDYVVSTVTGKTTCVITSKIFQQYATYGVILILGKLLPICIAFFFGFLTYRNVQEISYRTLPFVRRELDKQLTVMVLVVVVFAFFTVMPYAFVYMLLQMPSFTTDPFTAAQLQFASTLTLAILYMYFAVSVT